MIIRSRVTLLHDNRNMTDIVIYNQDIAIDLIINGNIIPRISMLSNINHNLTYRLDIWLAPRYLSKPNTGKYLEIGQNVNKKIYINRLISDCLTNLTNYLITSLAQLFN